MKKCLRLELATHWSDTVPTSRFPFPYTVLLLNVLFQRLSQMPKATMKQAIHIYITPVAIYRCWTIPSQHLHLISFCKSDSHYFMVSQAWWSPHYTLLIIPPLERLPTSTVYSNCGLLFIVLPRLAGVELGSLESTPKSTRSPTP